MPDPIPTAQHREEAREVEALAAEFHEVYQAEARRQGDVRHSDDYAALPERIKEFDRVLARHALRLVAAAEARGEARGREDQLRAVTFALCESHNPGHVLDNGRVWGFCGADRLVGKMFSEEQVAAATRARASAPPPTTDGGT